MARERSASRLVIYEPHDALGRAAVRVLAHVAAVAAWLRLPESNIFASSPEPSHDCSVFVDAVRIRLVAQ